MKIPRLVAISLLVFSSFGAAGVTPRKTDLETMYDKAFREFDANHFEEALKALDALDVRQPDLAESQNLRGVVLMRKGDDEKADPAVSRAYYDKAQAAFRKALDVEPESWNAQFNLAQIPFLKKDWVEARNRFEALVAGNSDEMKGEAGLLIQYKILLTFVLQGKENMVDWIVHMLEGEKDSPALYYSNAAIAFQHNNQKEAKEWMDAADKHYPAALNKLFAESFYEIGWVQRPPGETRAAIEINSTAEHAAQMKSDAQANFERAERAFQQRDFPAALTFLDLADEGAPERAESLNLRGEIYLKDQKFDAAEDAFVRATKADAKFREAQYNLAQIRFKKKEYAKAREQFEALYAQTSGGDKNQAAQLIKYKIFLTLLLEGNDTQAQQMMDQFKFTGDTPALYYAQAAWAFNHDSSGQGDDWVKSARKIYSPALNIIFADIFYDLGWLQVRADTVPARSVLAQADAAPAIPAPEMRFGGADSLLPPEIDNVLAAAGSPANTSVQAPSAAATTAQKAPVAAATAAAMAASSPVPVLKTQGAPAVAAKKLPPVLAQASPLKSAAAKKTPVAAAAAVSSAAVPPAATALAPMRIREYLQPSLADLADHVSDPRTLLVGGILLGGVVIVGWFVLRQGRRRAAANSLNGSAMPLTEPPFDGGATAGEEHRLSRENLQGCPPKLSLQLKASETAVRKPTLPSGVPDLRSGSPLVGESGIPLPDEASGPISEVRPAVPSTLPPAAKMPDSSASARQPDDAKSAPVAPEKPLRDEQEVLLAAHPKPAVARRPKPSFLPTTLRVAKAAAAPPPSIVSEPKKPALESQKIVPIEAKKVIPPVAEPKQAAPEPAKIVGVEAKQVTPPVIVPAKPAIAADFKPAVPPVRPIEQPVVAREEPVSQGQPFPQLISVASVTTPEPKVEEKPAQRPSRIEAETAAIAAITGATATQRSVATPTFAAKAITTQPAAPVGPALTAPTSEPPVKPNQEAVRLEPETAAIAAGVTATKAPQPPVETPAIPSNVTPTKPTTPPEPTPVIMPEPTPITAINEARPAPAPAADRGQAGAPTAADMQPAASLQNAVQLTFSLEIASLELTPDFKMGSLQLKPISTIVSMRLAPSAQPQPAMNLQVTFELSSVKLDAGGSFGTVRLTPSSAQRPTPITSPSFEVSGLQLASGSAGSPVQLTPTQRGKASVLMTASFHIATVEFSPSFEIASVVLNSISKNVAVQLPGAGPSSIEGAPVFEIGDVQLAGNNDLGLIQLNPLGGSGRRG